jgi:hypothetical protein
MSFKLFAMETTLHRLRAVSKNPHRSLQSAARKGQNFERSILKYLLNFVVKKINQLTTIFNSFASIIEVIISSHSAQCTGYFTSVFCFAFSHLLDGFPPA